MASKRKEAFKETQLRGKKAKKDPMAKKFEEIAGAFDILPIADEVKMMLAEVLPCSLGEFSDQRHDFQQRIVEAVAGVLGEAGAALSVAVDNARSQSCEVTSQKPVREKDVAEALTKLEAAKAETQRLKFALAEKATAFRAATASLAEAERTKKLDAQTSQDASKKKVSLETALEDLKVLTSISPEEADAQKKRDELVLFLSEFRFEESILIALPVALAKTPETRGQFDLIAISQLESEIGKMIGEQESILLAAKPGQEKCELDVQSACKHLDAVRAEQRAAAKEFDAASRQQVICEELSAASQNTARELAQSCKSLQNALYAAEAEVELFEQGPMETFKALRERITPAPTTEQVEELQIEHEAEPIMEVEAAAPTAAVC